MVWEPDRPHTNPPCADLKEHLSMTTPGRPVVPKVDATLAALAIVEQFNFGEYDNVDTLLDSVDTRHVLMGAIDLSRFLADMLGRAANTSPQAVTEHVRTTLMKLISDGELSAGSIDLPEEIAPSGETFSTGRTHQM